MALKKEIVLQSAFAIYTATDINGQGGAGFVYKVQDEQGTIYAIKHLNPQGVNSGPRNNVQRPRILYLYDN